MYGRAKPSEGRVPGKITVPQLRARKLQGTPGEGASRGHGPGEPRRIAMVTAYDYTMATLVDEAGVDMVLVGDSLGMVVQGLANTIPVSLDEMIYHCRAVARGLRRAHLVGDLPFMSYQVSPAQAVESSGKLMKEGSCESVKLEGGVEVAEHVHRIVRAGIPVVGHVGLTPQSVHALGGFKVQGRSAGQADKLLSDARALEEAGAFALVLEAIPPDLAEEVTREIGIPTIGIGAGAGCDGQVLVCTDLLGMVRGHTPRFAKRFTELGDAIVGAVQTYVTEVQAGTFPGPEHAYKANGARPPPRAADDESAALLDAPMALDLWH